MPKEGVFYILFEVIHSSLSFHPCMELWMSDKPLVLSKFDYSKLLTKANLMKMRPKFNDRYIHSRLYRCRYKIEIKMVSSGIS